MSTLAAAIAPAPSSATAETPGAYFAAIPISEMFIDEGYQREINDRRVKKMARGWNIRMVGVIEISDRGPDSTPRYAVIDGHHRYAAAGLHDPDTVLAVKVHTGLTRAQEAQLFHDLDATRRSLSGWDKWKARFTGEDPVVVDIERIVTESGFRISNAPLDGNLRCIRTCETIYKLGGAKLLHETLDLIAEVWGTCTEAVDGPLVHGLAVTLYTHGSDIDIERLAEILLDVEPRKLKALAVAVGERDGSTLSLSKRVAQVIRTTYNSAKGTTKLDDHRPTRQPRLVAVGSAS